MMIPLAALRIAHIEKLGLLLTIGLMTFLTSVFLTPLVRKLVTKLGMIDQPDARRVNTTPIPRGGGIGVILAFHVGVCVAFQMLPSMAPALKLYIPFLIGSLALGAVGVIDDYRGMRSLTKLCCQIAVAVWLCYNGYLLHLEAFLPAGTPHAVIVPLEYALTVFWIVGAINAFNLIDGLDGLATGLACIAAFGMGGALFFANRLADVLPYLILLSACLGFMPYNFHPATIFLGDTGSMFLGLTLAAIPLVLPSVKGEAFLTTVAPMLAIGVPIIDVALAIVRRTIRRIRDRLSPPTGEGNSKGVMQPDKQHLHHRILEASRGRQRQAVLLIYGIASLVIITDLLFCFRQSMSRSIFLLTFLVFCWLLVRQMTTVEFWDVLNLVREHAPRQRRRLLKIVAYVILDVVCCTVAYLLALFLFRVEFSRLILLCSPVYFAPSLILLYLTRVYHKAWTRPRHYDFVLLYLSILLGCALTSVLRQLFMPEVTIPLRADLVFCLMFITGTTFYRSIASSLIEFANYCERLVLRRTADSNHAVAIGGGTGFLILLRYLQKNIGKNNVCIDAILDDDPNLLGAVIGGIPVRGTTEDLEDFLNRNPTIKSIILTVHLPTTQHNQILATAAKVGLPVREFQTTIVPAVQR